MIDMLNGISLLADNFRTLSDTLSRSASLDDTNERATAFPLREKILAVVQVFLSMNPTEPLADGC